MSWQEYVETLQSFNLHRLGQIVPLSQALCDYRCTKCGTLTHFISTIRKRNKIWTVTNKCSDCLKDVRSFPVKTASGKILLFSYNEILSNTEVEDILRESIQNINKE